MASLKLKLKTWSCDTCGYKQDFEPTQQMMRWHMVDSVPSNVRGEAWARLAAHDWRVPVCPACLSKDGKEYDLSQKRKVSKGLKSAPGVFSAELAGTENLTPELDSPVVVTTSSDVEIDGLMKVTDPNRNSEIVSIRSIEEADEEDRVLGLQGKELLNRIALTDEERAEYRDKVKASIQELVDRDLLDETDADTKAVKDNLAAGELKVR